MRRTTLALAFAVTTVGLAMAGASAWQRSADPLSGALLVALAGCVVIGAHVLPALCKSWAVWPLWLVCFCVAAAGHANWLMLASETSAGIRVEGSASVKAIDQRREALEKAVGQIKARPVELVAMQLARVQDDARKQALTVELDRARYRDQLAQELVTLARDRADLIVTEGVTDPANVGVSRFFGVPPPLVGLALALVTACLVELMAVVLWRAALRPEPVAPVAPAQVVNQPPEPMMMVTAQPEPVQAPADPVAMLRKAVARGQVQVSVRSIRAYLGCSQARASELRRALG